MDKVFIIIDFTVKNLSPGDYLFNPLNVKLRDVNGYGHRHSFLGTELDTYFSVTSIAPGKLASGVLAYQIPMDASGLQLELDSYLGKPLHKVVI